MSRVSAGPTGAPPATRPWPSGPLAFAGSRATSRSFPHGGFRVGFLVPLGRLRDRRHRKAVDGRRRARLGRPPAEAAALNQPRMLLARPRTAIRPRLQRALHEASFAVELCTAEGSCPLLAWRRCPMVESAEVI